MKHFFLYIVFIISISSSAQTPCFNADVTRGCVPLTVTMQNCSGSAGVYYTYGDGTLTDDPNPVHTYTNPGIYTVKQKITTAGSTDEEIKTNYIEVLTLRPPTFDVKICSGRKLELTVTDNIDNEYSIDYGDGSPLVTAYAHTSLPPHTYTDDAAKTITITPVSCGLSTSTTFYPLDIITRAEISQIKVLNQHTTNGQINIRFYALINQKYQLQQSINGGVFSTIHSLHQLSGIQDLIINNLNTHTNQYCYRLVSFDDCSNPVETSSTVCSFSLHAQNDAVNSAIDLSWTNSGSNIKNYHIYRHDTPAPIATLPSSNSSFTDNQVNCAINYCYSVITEYNHVDGTGNHLQSISAEQCITATSNTIPPSIQSLNSSIDNQDINLSWDLPTGFNVDNYQLQRSENGGSFVHHANSSLGNYRDKDISVPENSYCYTIVYQDACNNAAPAGNISCPVILNMEIDEDNNMLNELSWTVYTGGNHTVDAYFIEILNEHHTVISSINNGLNTTFIHNTNGLNLQTIKYRIAVSVAGKGIITYSNLAEINYEGEIYLPNAFTPDGDNVNDIFLPKGKFIHSFKLTIFNRWGEVVFTSNQFNEGWNGHYKNSLAPADTYAYLIEATDLWNKKLTLRGSVILLK